jgi:hypothetical protein
MYDSVDSRFYIAKMCLDSEEQNVFPEKRSSLVIPCKKQHNFNKMMIKFVPLHTVCGGTDDLFEQNRFQVFENRPSKGVFGTRSKPVTGKWRKLHSEIHI